MWFNDKKLVIPKSNFRMNEKVLYTDKAGNEHKAKVLSVSFKGLNDGYIYGIETEELINGNSKFLVKENNLKRYKKTKKNETMA